MARPLTTSKVPVRAWPRARAAWERWVPVRDIAAMLGCTESNVRERARLEGWPARRQARSSGRRQLGERVTVRCPECGGQHQTAVGVAPLCQRQDQAA